MPTHVYGPKTDQVLLVNESRIAKNTKKNFEEDQCVHYLDYGGSFTGRLIYQIIKLCSRMQMVYYMPILPQKAVS